MAFSSTKCIFFTFLSDSWVENFSLTTSRPLKNISNLIVTKSIHVYGKVSTDCIVKVAEGEKEGEGVG